MGNFNFKGGAAGVRGSHLSQKTRKMGHPTFVFVDARSKAALGGGINLAAFSGAEARFYL